MLTNNRIGLVRELRSALVQRSYCTAIAGGKLRSSSERSRLAEVQQIEVANRAQSFSLCDACYGLRPVTSGQAMYLVCVYQPGGRPSQGDEVSVAMANRRKQLR